MTDQDQDRKQELLRHAQEALAAGQPAEMIRLINSAAGLGKSIGDSVTRAELVMDTVLAVAGDDRKAAAQLLASDDVWSVFDRDMAAYILTHHVAVTQEDLPKRWQN